MEYLLNAGIMRLVKHSGLNHVVATGDTGCTSVKYLKC